MDDRAFFCTGLALPSEDIDIACVTNKKNGKKNGEKGFRKKEARRREKYVENWYYPTYYQAYVKMSNGDPHRMKPSQLRLRQYSERPLGPSLNGYATHAIF